MSTSPTLDPAHVLWSAPESKRAGRPLIVLMHGWSYDERHLFGFAHLFPGELVVASVRAPYAEAGGYAWFPSQGNPIGDPQPRVANDAADAVLDWLGTLPAASSTGLLGFSQGGAMALQLMRREPGRFDYGVQLAAHTSPEQVVYRGLGHDVAGPEVTDFITFVARQFARGHRPLPAGATRSTADGEPA